MEIDKAAWLCYSLLRTFLSGPAARGQADDTRKSDIPIEMEPGRKLPVMGANREVELKKNMTLRTMVLALAIFFVAAIPSLIRSAEEKPDTQLTTEQALQGTGLTEEEKKWVKEKQKELLKKAAEMITDGMEDGRLKTTAQYMIANVHDWSAFGGKLSAGDYRDAVNLMATVGAKELNGYIEDRLPEGTVKSGYKFLTDNVDDAKAVAIAMLDRSKTWADVGNVAWDKTKEKTKKTLEEKSDELVKTVINYAFGDGSLLGYTPGDAYLLLVKTEMQVISVWEQKYDMRKQDELYAIYKAARDAGKVEFEAFDTEVSALLLEGPYAKAFGRETSEQAVRNMFKQSYEESPERRDFGWWLRDKVREKLAEEKKKADVTNVMEQLRQGLQRDLNAYLDKVRRKQQELLEKEMTAEIKKKRAAVITEARQQLALLERTAAQIQAHCKAFEGAMALMQKVYEELKGIQAEAGNLPALVAHAQKASKYAEEAKRLSDATAAAERLYGEFESACKNAEEAATQSCNNSERIPQAPTKDQAKNLLDNSVREAGKSSRAMTTAEEKSKALKKQESDFALAVQAFTQKYSQGEVQEIQNSINRITSLLNRLQGGGEARLQGQFNGAMAQMRDAVTKNDSLLAYARGLQTTIKAKLTPYPQNQEMTEILTKTDGALTDASSCASSCSFAWSGGSERWNTRQVPKFPRIDQALLAQARAAVGAQDTFRSILSPTDAVRKMGELAKGMDTRLYEMELARRMYEKCVQNAILAYNDKWLFKVEIAGPQKASSGDEVTFEARVTSQSADRYSYRWYADGKELGSNTSTQKVTAHNLGDHTVNVVVWRWSQDTSSWVRAGEATHAIKVVSRLQRIDIAGPDQVAPKQRANYAATLVPPAEGRFGYTWSLDGRVIGSGNTTNTQIVDAPDAPGRHTLAVRVFVWMNQQWQHVADGSRAVDVRQPQGAGSRVVVAVRDSSAPVQGARVTLLPAGISKSGGDVVFEGIATGRIRLTVSAPGYLDESYELSHDGANPNGSGHTFQLRRTGRSYTSR